MKKIPSPVIDQFITFWIEGKNCFNCSGMPLVGCQTKSCHLRSLTAILEAV